MDRELADTTEHAGKYLESHDVYDRLRTCLPD
jgi:hypothetical protein